MQCSSFQGESVLKIIIIAAAAAAAAAGAAVAQALPDPSDAAAPAPAPAYRSAFEGVPAGVEEEQVDWRKANADVARFARGHADYVKWEEEQQHKGGEQCPGGAAPAPAAPAAPAAPPAAAAPPVRQQGHGHH